MLETLKFGEGNWANKTDSTLAYSDQYGNFKAIPFDFTRATTATRVNKQGLIESVNEGIARIDYSNSTQGALLLEPQRTNLIPYSNDFSAASWIKTNANVTSNSTISPDGTVNASLITHNLTSGYHHVRRAVVGSTSASFSVFVKEKELRYIQIASNNTTQQFANFDVKDGVVGDVGTNFSNAKIEDYGNGWHRCSVVSDNQYNTMYVSLITSLTSAWNEIWLPLNSTDGLYLYGAQVEESSYATSYIPTSGAIATRNQEICNDATPEINSAEGVLYAEISALANGGEIRYLGLNDGSNDNRVVILYHNSNNNIRAILSSGGTKYVDVTSDVTSVLDFHKVAIRYSSSEFSLWIDGVEVATDTSLNAPIGLNNLDFSINGGGAFLGNTKGLKLYNTALTDAQLQTLTTI